MKNILLKLIIYLLGVLTVIGLVFLFKEWVCAILIWLIFS